MNSRSSRFSHFVAALGSLIWAILVVQAVRADNILSNGDFESAKWDPAWPDEWGNPGDGTVTWEQHGPDANGGGGNGHFLRLQAAAPGKSILEYRSIPLRPEWKAIEVTLRGRTTNLKVGDELWHDARVVLDFKNKARKKIGSGSPIYFGSTSKGWVKRRSAFLIPDGAVTLEVMPALFYVKSGQFDLDDIVVQPVDPAPIIAAEKARIKVPVPPREAPAPEKWAPPLRVVGNKIRNERTGGDVWLQGVNVVSLEFLVAGENVLRAAQVAVEDWKSNIIRLPVRDDFWLGRHRSQKDGGAAYRQLVDDVVTLITNRGAYVLLDLHRYRAPKMEHVDFWKDAAAHYKNHPAILFDLLNEPHGISWEVWRNGGFVSEKKTQADEDSFLGEEERNKNAEGFDSPGMQGLVDAVRSTGADNVIVAGGLDWAYDLRGIVNGFALDEREGGRGIVYSTHIYNWKHDWAGNFLLIADRHPILVGEVGADVKKMDFMPADIQENPYTWAPDLIGMVQKYRLHWTAFSFHPQATPVMLQDWTFKPTPFWGIPVKRALAGEQFELKRMR